MLPALSSVYGPIRQMAYVESNLIAGLVLEIIEWNDITRSYRNTA
ncbi:MAG: hypothetical protein V7711_03255 [Pseudomonadales bacterium]